MGGEYWLFLGVLLLIISLAMHQVPLLLFAVVFLLVGGVSRLWSRYCLRRVEYRRTLSRDRVFLGDEIILEVEVANRKPLPLPWLRIDDELPAEVNLLKGKAVSSGERRVVLSNIFPLNWYHRVKRRFPMRCPQRGSFVFGPTHIYSGDLFGFFRRETVIEKLDYLTVYPRLVPLEKLGIPSQQLFGDIRLKRHLYQDQVLTAGVRDYYPGDSLKRIHWKSTARLGKLQTRVYEPTTTTDISLFLDVRTVPAPYWGVVPNLLELGIMTAASVSQRALEEGYRVGLNVNQVTRFSQGPVRVPCSRHVDQLTLVLNALAQLYESEALPISRFVQQEAHNLPWGSTLVVISAQPSEELLATLLDLKQVGRSVALIKIGGAALDIMPDNFPVYSVNTDIAWDKVEKIDIKTSPVTIS